MQLIRENRDKDDFKLPSETQLANKFNASRVSVRNALLLLERNHCIIRIRGKGTFINRQQNIEDSDDIRNIVACIIPNTDSCFSRQLLEGIREYCSDNRFELVTFLSGNDINTEKLSIQACMDLQCRGLILFPCDNELYNERLLSLSFEKFPLVLVDRKLKGIDISCFSTDHYNSMIETVRMLKQHNFQHIVFITPQNHFCSSVEDRIRGFEQGILENYGMFTANNLLYIKDYQPESLEETCADFLRKNPQTQVIIVNSGAGALAVYRAAHSLGILIPEQLQLVFFDDECEALHGIVQWDYSAILQDAKKIGYSVAQALCREITDGIKAKDTKFNATIVDRVADKYILP